MRIAILAPALAVLLPGTLAAATIKSPLTLGCYDVATHRQMREIADAGDKAALVKRIEGVIADRSCARLPVGLDVSPGATSYPYICVTPPGSDRCLWVEFREVQR